MAISTNDEKLALMEWDQWYEPGLPLDEDMASTGTKLQLLLGYPRYVDVSTKFTIGSTSPIFYPNVGFIGHSTSIGPFVFPDSGGAAATAPEAPPGDVTTIYADYTATSANYTIMADCSVEDANITVTLPPLATSDGLELNIVKDDTTSNLVIIDGYLSEPIDTSETQTLSTPDSTLSIIGDTDGGRWKIL